MPHWEDGPDFKRIFSALDNITRALEEAFPNTPIIPCLGNHDSYPAVSYWEGDGEGREILWSERHRNLELWGKQMRGLCKRSVEDFFGY